MENNFDSGNLATDIANITKEINELQKLREQKEHLQKRIKLSNQEKYSENATIAKVNQMMSQNVPVKFERNTTYANYAYGLKKFFISLNINNSEKYNNLNNLTGRQKETRILAAMQSMSDHFGTITSVKPYETQYNVTRMEYDYTVNLLRDLLPIGITVKQGYDDCINYSVDCNCDFIYIDAAGNAYISGISLNGRN